MFLVKRIGTASRAFRCACKAKATPISRFGHLAQLGSARRRLRKLTFESKMGCKSRWNVTPVFFMKTMLSKFLSPIERI
jgi:hypothetical protein